MTLSLLPVGNSRYIDRVPVLSLLSERLELLSVETDLLSEAGGYSHSIIVYYRLEMVYSRNGILLHMKRHNTGT